jgi:FixJ family two-component response regulator
VAVFGFDSPSLRLVGLRLLRAAGYEACGYASAAEYLLARVGAKPGCIVLDVRMPGLSGIDLQARLAEQDNALPIIFLTGHGDIPMSVKAMKAGSVDFLTKPVQREELFSAIRVALARDAEARSTQDKARRLHSCYESLTTRERDVLALVVAGNLNKHIAKELKISERTVKAHRAQVMMKLQARSLAEAC